MRKLGLQILFLITILSCGNKHEGEQKPTILSNVLSITDNEDKGIKEILGFYGGQCKYSIGASTSTKDGKKKYFELEVSKSSAIEKMEQTAQMPASNIAYLFFKNLKREENNYNEIHVVLIFSDGQQMTSVFPSEQLRIVGAKMNAVDKVVGLIKIKDFDAIEPMLDNSDTALLPYDKKELISKLKSVDTRFGNVTEGFRPFGFRIVKVWDRDFLHISGAIIRDKQSNEFSVDLELNRKDDKINLLQYKL